MFQSQASAEGAGTPGSSGSMTTVAGAPSNRSIYRDMVFIDQLDANNMTGKRVYLHGRRGKRKLGTEQESIFGPGFHMKEALEGLKKSVFDEAAPPSFFKPPQRSESRSTSHGTARRKKIFALSFAEAFKRSPSKEKVQMKNWGFHASEDPIFPNSAWIYLAIMGSLAFLLCYSVTMSAQKIGAHVAAGKLWMFTVTGSHLLSNIFYVFLRSTLAGSAYVFVQLVSPMAVGSGIPEMKCVLSGVYIPKALSPKTLVAKMVGLTLALGSGLSIGRLGPFMHISAISAALVARSGFFPHLAISAKQQIQAMSAALAAGVGATSGAPIGGTLLAIELMSSFYFIHWLPLSFYCVAVGYFVQMRVAGGAGSYFITDTSFDLKAGNAFLQMFLFCLLGCITGMLGALFCKVVSFLFQARVTYFKGFKSGLALVVGFAAFHAMVCLYFGGVMLLPSKKEVTYLMESEGDGAFIDIPNRFAGTIFENCAGAVYFSVVKFLLAAVSLVLPIPAGTFGPIFEIGAGFGRLFGEILKVMGMDWLDSRIFAVTGAAALTTGTLHTVSVAVIMLELTGSSVNILPLLVACVVSYMVSKKFSSDLFSELIRHRRLPLILGLRETCKYDRSAWRDRLADLKVKSFMREELLVLTLDMTRSEVYQLLAEQSFTRCPLVNNTDERILLGSVSRLALEEALVTERSEESVHEISRDLRPLKLLESFSTNEEAFQEGIDRAPFQISDATPYWKCSTYFQMLGVTTMYVVDRRGRLVGILTKPEFIELGAKAILADARGIKTPKEPAARSTEAEEDNANQPW